MIEKQPSLPYSIQQFLRFQGFRKTKNDKILLWAQKNDLIALENGKILVVKLPNFIRGMRALSGIPKIETPVLILPDEAFSILHLASFLELPQRLLIPVIPLNQIRLRSLCKILCCLNSDEVSDVFLDTKRSEIPSSAMSLLNNMPSPYAVLSSIEPQTWDMASVNLTKTPSLLKHFQLGNSIPRNISWQRLLGALPARVRQLIGLQLARMGFIEEVNELKMLLYETLPKESLITISCYGYLAIWKNRKKAHYYKEFLKKLGFPIGKGELVDFLFKDPSANAEFVSVVGAAHLLETIASSHTHEPEAVIQEWIEVISNSKQLKDSPQNILLGTLCYLHHFAEMSPEILLASIHFPYPDVCSLGRSLCNYYLDFIEENPSLLSNILTEANCNLYQTVWAPIVQLRLVRVARKGAQSSLRKQFLDNDLTKKTQTPNIRQSIRVGRFLSRVREFSKANELYASIPPALHNKIILSERILNHLCQFQLQQVASLLEDPLSSEIMRELKESLAIRLLRSDGKLLEAEQSATNFLNSSNSPTNPVEVIFELAQIQSAIAQYSASINILESLELLGMPSVWFDVIEFETQLQHWCKDSRLLKKHTVSSPDPCNTKHKVDLRTLLASALSPADPESLAQECFCCYVDWDMPYLSYQHWFLLCGIALALRAKNEKRASEFWVAWKQDPWIDGRCNALGISIPEVDISSADDLSFWKGLLRSWGPEVPAHQRWSELLSTIGG